MLKADSRLFNSDPAAGITEIFHYDEMADTCTIETRQDITDLIEGNKAEYASIDERAKWGDMHRVASIPMNLYMKMRAEGITRDAKAMRKFLNDPDNRFFRTRPGRI